MLREQRRAPREGTHGVSCRSGIVAFAAILHRPRSGTSLRCETPSETATFAPAAEAHAQRSGLLNRCASRRGDRSEDRTSSPREPPLGAGERPSLISRSACHSGRFLPPRNAPSEFFFCFATCPRRSVATFSSLPRPSSLPAPLLAHPLSRLASPPIFPCPPFTRAFPPSRCPRSSSSSSSTASLTSRSPTLAT
jgi:hypothetical protein